MSDPAAPPEAYALLSSSPHGEAGDYELQALLAPTALHSRVCFRLICPDGRAVWLDGPQVVLALMAMRSEATP